MQKVEREIPLSFCKVHLLHHADEAPGHGHRVPAEPRRQGYEICPRTLYPPPGRGRDAAARPPERTDAAAGRRAGITGRRSRGEKVLMLVREQIKEFCAEVVAEAGGKRHD